MDILESSEDKFRSNGGYRGRGRKGKEVREVQEVTPEVASKNSRRQCLGRLWRRERKR